MFLLSSFKRTSEKRWQNLGEECQRRLREQRIAPGNPGTILKDIETFLEFVGPAGIATQSDNASLPAERLPELSARIGPPLTLGLKRPLLRDYPNLAGLFILLRVMGLLELQGNRLVVCPAALEFWRGLNPTEQYFALLEGLLFQAQSSVLGKERSREEEEAFDTVVFFLSQLSERWHQFDSYESVYTLGSKGEMPPWNLFVQQQLGLIELRQRVVPEAERKRSGTGQGWHVDRARLTPWGTAVTWALLDFAEEEIAAAEQEAAEEAGEQPLERAGELFSLESPRPEGGAEAERGAKELAEADWGLDEAAEEWEPEPEFGILQATFQPYFPEWQKVYARPKPPVQKGQYIFKVNVSGWQAPSRGAWRRLSAPASATLDELAGAILAAFKFDDDHLYDFRYRDRRGKNRVYNHPAEHEGPFTTDIRIGEMELAPKDEMLFTYDYGDNWQFKVKLERIEAKATRLRKPKVIGSAGKAPKQYPDADW